MTDEEHIIISAVRYALGRMTYIVSLTVYYVIKKIDRNKLTLGCLKVIKKDIEEAKEKDNLGMACDRAEWLKLLDKINGAI